MTTKPYFYGIVNLLSIPDSYQRQRCEMVLGTPCLNSRAFLNMPQFGVYYINNTEDFIYEFKSTLTLHNLP